MACDLLGQLKDLVCQIEGSCCNPPAPASCCQSAVCPPTTQPIATCCMVCPPPILAPTVPQPVKPLQLPCCNPCGEQPPMSEDEALKTRYANYYNNYNIDWHAESACEPKDPYVENRKGKCKGVTTFGKSPCCEDYLKKKAAPCQDKGCPTGFKPCTMKLCPPCNGHPCGVWNAEVQPCPPKSKKKQRRRPCC